MTTRQPATAAPDPARRRIMIAGLGAALLPAFGQAAGAPVMRLLSPATLDGRHYVVALDPETGIRRSAPLPMRGHGMLVDPRRPNEALVIARRPGTIVVRVDLAQGRVLRRWDAGDDRHFFGHACYSADRRTLFFTENDADTGQGRVSVRDADDLRVLAEYPSHGIGPHELLLLPDGVTLAVANGGILTLPETGRVKLNRGRIESSLVYLDSRDGRLLGKYPLPSTELSLRHLALASDGSLAAALQFEGDKQRPGTPLMAFHKGEPALRMAEAPQEAWNRMRHYAASVAFDPASARFALSCPLGDVIACWSSGGDYAGEIALPKVSGIAFDKTSGFASNELGELYTVDPARLAAVRQDRIAGMQWDNHLYIG